jgi:hypothetical protein
MLKRMLGREAGPPPSSSVLASPTHTNMTPRTAALHATDPPFPASSQGQAGGGSIARSEQSIQYMNLIMDLQQRTRLVLKQLAETHTSLMEEIKKVNKRNLESLNVIGGMALAKDSKYNEIITSALQSVLPGDDTCARVSKINFSIYGINALGQGEVVSPLSLEVEGAQEESW